MSSPAGRRRPAQLARRLAVLTLAAGVILPAAGGRGEPYRPAHDGVVLERLPPPADPRQRAIRRLTERAAAQPGDLEVAVELARSYLELAQREGDPRYAGRAQGALEPWWASVDPPPPVRLVRAAILRTQHDFEGALADLDALVAANPSHAQAQLDRALVLVTLGDYARAERACFKVARLGQALAGATCLANAGSLSGMAGPSYRALTGALAAQPGADPEVRRWALTVLGEIAARRGDPVAAERHFRDALALGPDDAYLLAVYADLLLGQQRFTEVSALLEEARTTDALLLRRAIAARQLGAAEAEPLVRELETRFDAARARGTPVHRLDEARLALELQGDAQRALDLARTSWTARRDPVAARILLQAALASREPAVAAPVLDWLAATRIEDVTLAALAAELEGLAS